MRVSIFRNLQIKLIKPTKIIKSIVTRKFCGGLELFGPKGDSGERTNEQTDNGFKGVRLPTLSSLDFCHSFFLVAEGTVEKMQKMDKLGLV